jgi:CDP-diacylglycerol--serine O-phosphatidyltransferase
LSFPQPLGSITGVKRFLRYLAPNLVTGASVFFGMASLYMTTQGRWVEAAWFTVWSVVSDRLDGMVARAVKGASEFGVQLDSFADFLNFGVAPTVLSAVYLSQPGSPFAEGGARVILLLSLALWFLAVVFRLARFNVVGGDPVCKHLFFGVPTTVMGGLFSAGFLALLKYGATPTGASLTLYDEPMLLGSGGLGMGIWKIWPAFMLTGALLMASTLRIVKPSISNGRALKIWGAIYVGAGYIAGGARRIPEFLVVLVFVYVGVSIIWGQMPSLRKNKVPRLFPADDNAPQPPRPEDDGLPDL